MKGTLFVKQSLAFLIALLAAGTSCGPTPDSKETASQDASVPEQFWTAEASKESRPAAEVRADAKDGDEVYLRGRVRDFSEDLAVFTLIDESLVPCNEGEDDVCPTPWDYCCIEPTVRAENTVTVELHRDGQPIAGVSLRGWHGLDYLDHVIVRGLVVRDSSGNVRVNAETITKL